ncbi:glucose dehydrogenase [Trichonephila inaurata madagascariensis]|uniref:Glucose dehydrogenase n=1 Tax=Trichonephila inaurata madagascariensis TaxID=2747483 RepID=A0A8X6YV79_9ARAC|nr:glucose dehydrogenase [Trichonephila inaurata madagascariensis]
MWDPSFPYNLTFEASYPTPYAASQFLSLILFSMMGQKHTPKTTKDIKSCYDYIIVGAGSAGSVLAARLAEKECVTILLLEAGKSSPKVTDIPTAARSFIQSDIDWNYSTAPQEHTGAGLVNRSVAWPSGKTIGGSSVINAMLKLRGNKKNYDDWAAQGASGWSYEEVLPYFMKLEDNTDEEYVKNGYHGIGGPVTVSKPPYDSALKAAILEAAKDKGYRIGDINGPDATGVLTTPQGGAVTALLAQNDTKEINEDPDYQLTFWEGNADDKHRIKPEYFEAIYGPYKEKPLYGCISHVLQPKSRGEVTLRSSNPYDPPIIDPKYFSHPEDMKNVVAGLKKCKEFGQSEVLRNIGSKLLTTVYPGCEDVVNDDDKYFSCMARSIVLTANHQTGTARMGNPRDPSTVVDPKLRVKGIRNLRVVDASVMPIIPSGNTNGPTMMLAEKASDIIKETIRCESDNDMYSILLEES